jgi:hypothetical protein
MNADPAIAEWAKQNVTPSPPLLDVLLGLGLWLPFAIVGAWRSYKVSGAKAVLISLSVWLAVTLVLLYVPYALQRRFIGGVFIPLSVLAGLGVAWQLSKLSRMRIPALVGLIACGFSSNVIVLLALLISPSQADPKVYLTNDEAAALRWLETQVTPSDVVLADTRLGLFVPGWTGARTVYGHPMETIAATVKRSEVEAFYESDDESLLTRYPITYILNGQPPADWHEVFRSGEIIVYGR